MPPSAAMGPAFVNSHCTNSTEIQSISSRTGGEQHAIHSERKVLGLTRRPIRAPGHARCHSAGLPRHEHRSEGTRRKPDGLMGSHFLRAMTPKAAEAHALLGRLVTSAALA